MRKMKAELMDGFGPDGEIEREDVWVEDSPHPDLMAAAAELYALELEVQEVVRAEDNPKLEIRVFDEFGNQRTYLVRIKMAPIAEAEEL